MLHRRPRRIAVSAAILTVASTAAVAAVSTATASTPGALPAADVDVLSVAGIAGIPNDATMVAATITAIAPDDDGWIKAFPCDAAEPETANLTYVESGVANNMVLARLSPAGKLCIATRALTDYVVDVVGFVPSDSGITALATPTRALDTRTGVGGDHPSPVPNSETIALQLAGEHDIPSEAGLVVFNLTAVGGPDAGRITAHACDEDPPPTSSVNFPANRNIANLVVSRLSPDGQVCFTAKNGVDIVVDVAAFASNGIELLPAPSRISDSRDVNGLVAAGSITQVDADLPDDATAAIVNIASVGATERGFVVAYPCDEERPPTSNLNHGPAAAASAGAITKLSADGSFCLYNRSGTELVVDLAGHTTDEAYVPITPARIKDTRRCPVIVVPEVVEGGLQRAEYRYNIRDLRTGGIVTASVNGDIFGIQDSSRSPIVAGDCSRIIGIDTNDPCCDPEVAVVTSPLFGDGGTATAMGGSPSELLDDGRLVGASIFGLSEAETGERVVPISPDIEAGHAAVSRNGRVLVAVDDGNTNEQWIEVWNLDRGDRLHRFRARFKTMEIDVSDDGRYLAVTSLRSESDGTGNTSRLFGTVDIMTIDGTIVHSRTIEGAVVQNVAFVGRRSIIGCVLTDGSPGVRAAVVGYELGGAWSEIEVMANSPLFDERSDRWSQQCEQMGLG